MASDAGIMHQMPWPGSAAMTLLASHVRQVLYYRYPAINKPAIAAAYILYPWRVFNLTDLSLQKDSPLHSNYWVDWHGVLQDVVLIEVHRKSAMISTKLAVGYDEESAVIIASDNN